MTKPVHPFKSHLARWTQAKEALPTAHEAAKNAAVGHVKQTVTHAVKNAKGMSPEDVGVFWYKDRPHLSVSNGPTADLEYGTLDKAPQATIRNAARRADRHAVKIYHNTIWRGIGF